MSPSTFDRREPPMGEAHMLCGHGLPRPCDAEGDAPDAEDNGHYVTIYVAGCDSQEMADDAIAALCRGAAQLAHGEDDEDHAIYATGQATIAEAMHVRGERIQIVVVPD